jgi:hypothetical protein
MWLYKTIVADLLLGTKLRLHSATTYPIPQV